VSPKDLVKQNFERLVAEGRQVRQKCGWSGSEYHKRPADDVYHRFRTESMNLVRRSCGEDSDHYRS